MTGALGKPSFWFLLVFAVIFDQVTKLCALHFLGADRSIPILGRFLTLKLIHNPGAAFSVGANNTWVFTVIALVVVVFLLVALRKISRRSWWITLAFLVAGAASNLLDRLFQPPAFGSGRVIDFINYNGWFIGNVADIYIVLAVAAVCYLLFANVPTSVEPQSPEHSTNVGENV